MRTRVIGVIGGSTCSAEVARQAERVGELIASRGAYLICGGLFGVMEAACRGAKAQEGTTIGVLPGSDKSAANQFVDIALPTGLGLARNLIIVRSSDAVIAIDGSYGTLSEISFCLQLGVPLVGLGTWDVDPKIIRAETPEAAVDRAFEALDEDE
ncbi:MAG: TIGR00725 family protein [Calditrichaeota bacterium]|nr:MAG: TIGR00725 family protein [Calditrichota bacterium]